MKMKKIDIKYIVAISISLIIGVSLIAYGYLNYDYKMKALESDKQAKAEELKTSQENEQEKTTALKNCLQQADLNAHNYWNRQCKDYGIDKNRNPYLKDDCSLDKYHSDAVDTYKKNEQEQCYQLYK